MDPRKAYDWLRLLRIGNSLIIGLGAVTGYVVGRGNNLFTALALYVSAMLIGCYGNTVNDIMDIEVDRVNKPWRPLPSGRISARSAWAASVLLASAGLALSLVAGLGCFIVAATAIVLLYLYSWRAKGTGFPGNLLISLLSLLVIVYGGLASPEPARSLAPGLYAFLIILGREVLKGIEDIEGDRAHGIGTIAARYGIAKALYVGSALLLAVVAISPLPRILMGMSTWYLIAAIAGVDIPIAAALVVIYTSPLENAWRATRILKIPLLMGLIAFILG